MLPILSEGAKKLGIELREEQLSRFLCLADALTLHAGTGIKDLESAQIRLLESVALAAVLDGEHLSLSQRSLIDLGSEAGIPGICLKVLEPSLKLTIIEPKLQRIEFLEAVLPQLGADDIDVLTLRPEELGHIGTHREQYHFALVKAQHALPTSLELALPLVLMGGKVLVPLGKKAEGQVSGASGALDQLKGSMHGVYLLQLEKPGAKLVVVDKDLPIDRRFPRRPGMAAKHPLR